MQSTWCVMRKPSDLKGHTCAHSGLLTGITLPAVSEKAELHQQPMKSSKPGWEGKEGRFGVLERFQEKLLQLFHHQF